MIEFEEDPDFTERERWAWREAQFCRLMVKTLTEAIPGWLEAHGVHPSKYQHAYEISVKIETWEQMAWHMMQPYHVRKENEQREVAQGS